VTGVLGDDGFACLGGRCMQAVVPPKAFELVAALSARRPKAIEVALVALDGLDQFGGRKLPRAEIVALGNGAYFLMR